MCIMLFHFLNSGRNIQQRVERTKEELVGKVMREEKEVQSD